MISQFKAISSMLKIISLLKSHSPFFKTKLKKLWTILFLEEPLKVTLFLHQLFCLNA